MCLQEIYSENTKGRALLKQLLILLGVEQLGGEKDETLKIFYYQHWLTREFIIFFTWCFTFFSSCSYFIPIARKELIEEGEMMWN